MRRLRAACLVAAAASLVACQTTTDLLEGKSVDYKSSGSLPPLEIPPDLTTPTRDNRYVVPETGRQAATLSVYQADRGRTPKPGETGILPAVEKMRVERSGSQRWLVINEPAEKLWPLVKDFWQENGFLVNLELPDAGLMETDWAENRAKIPQDMLRSMLGKLLDQVYSVPERDKFRTRMERGADPGVTEVYISHRGMVEIYVSEARAQTMWQPRNPDPELEAEFLRRLMIRLGAQEERAKQILTSTQPQPLRAALVKGVDGKELLDVYEPFDRAWRRVGLALDRVGFTVEDRDRQKGLYFVRYADSDALKPKEKGGVLDRLAFWKSDDSQKLKTEQYRVLVKQAGAGADNSEIVVLNKEGAAEQSQTTKRILTLLHEQLK